MKEPSKDEPAIPAVQPQVQKAFWLNGELVDGYNALLAARRARNPGFRERQLLNEAIEMLLTKEIR